MHKTPTSTQKKKRKKQQQQHRSTRHKVKYLSFLLLGYLFFTAASNQTVCLRECVSNRTIVSVELLQIDRNESVEVG